MIFVWVTGIALAYIIMAVNFFMMLGNVKQRDNLKSLIEELEKTKRIYEVLIGDHEYGKTH